MNNKDRSSLFPLIFLGILFFIFGFITWLNGTLIPYLKISCELNTLESMLVAFAFYISYFVMALPSAYILKKTGLKRGMSIGLMIMTIGALLFIPAAISRKYYVFLTGLFIIGTGLSVLQTASNPYVTIIGPIESAAKRISIMGICNKIAGILAPIILGSIVLANADRLQEELNQLSGTAKANFLDALAQRAILPYSIMAGLLFFLAILLRFSKLPEIKPGAEISPSSEKNSVKSSVFQFPYLIFGILAIYFYVGAEVIAGDTIGIYGQQQGIPLSLSKNLTALTLISMVIGYLAGILTIPSFVSQEKALTISALSGIITTFFVLITSGPLSVIFVALLGISNALMWPAIWPMSIKNLGKFTETASALLIMGIAGGATLPLIYGRLADSQLIGHQKAYLILIPCYLYILFFSLRGHKILNW